MPSLQSLTCTIEYGSNNTALREYGIQYGNGYVEVYICVPHIPVNFCVHFASNGYIAPGLSVFVFIDGTLQCSRSIGGLSPSVTPDTSNTPNVDFRLRQREDTFDKDRLIGRDWLFSKLKTTESDSNASDQVMQSLGKIEVVVTRFTDLSQPAPTSANCPAGQNSGHARKMKTTKPSRRLVKAGGMSVEVDTGQDHALGLDGSVDYDARNDPLRDTAALEEAFARHGLNTRHTITTTALKPAWQQLQEQQLQMYPPKTYSLPPPDTPLSEQMRRGVRSPIPGVDIPTFNADAIWDRKLNKSADTPKFETFAKPIPSGNSATSYRRARKSNSKSANRNVQDMPGTFLDAWAVEESVHTQESGKRDINEEQSSSNKFLPAKPSREDSQKHRERRRHMVRNGQTRESNKQRSRGQTPTFNGEKSNKNKPAHHPENNDKRRPWRSSGSSFDQQDGPSDNKSTLSTVFDPTQTRSMPYWYEQIQLEEARRKHGTLLLAAENLPEKIPRSFAKAKGLTHRVKLGDLAVYDQTPEVKKTDIDTVEKPYAVFIFKYRSLKAVEKKLGFTIDDIVPLEERLKEMSKEEIIKELLEARKMAGSGAGAKSASDISSRCSVKSSKAPKNKSGSAKQRHHHHHHRNHSRRKSETKRRYKKRASGSSSSSSLPGHHARSASSKTTRKQSQKKGSAAAPADKAKSDLGSAKAPSAGAGDIWGGGDIWVTKSSKAASKKGSMARPTSAADKNDWGGGWGDGNMNNNDKVNKDDVWGGGHRSRAASRKDISRQGGKSPPSAKKVSEWQQHADW